MSDKPYVPPAEWSALFDSAELFAAAVSPDGRLRYANRGLLSASGWAVGAPLRLPEGRADADDPGAAGCSIEGWLSGARPLQPVECLLTGVDGRQRSVCWHPSARRGPHGDIEALLLLGTDLGARHSTRERIRRSAEFFRALSDMRRAAFEFDDPQRLYEATCRILVESGRATMAWVGLVEGDELTPVAWSGAAREYTRGLHIKLHGRGDDTPPGPSAQAVLEACPVICNDFMASPRTRPWRERAATFGVKASAAFPIRRGGRTVGALNLYFPDVGAFDDALVELVELLVSDLAFALEHIDREAARAQAVREAQDGYARFRRVFESLPVAATIIQRPEGLFVDANEASSQLYGLAREELVGRTPRELGVGLDAASREALWERIDRSKAVRAWEARVRNRSGEWRDVLMNVEPIDFFGRPCLLNISIDITERRRIEQALSQRELQLSGIVETALEAIISIDADHKVVLFNPAAENMFGVAREEALGGGIERFIPDRYRAAHSGHVARYAAEGPSARSMGGARELVGLRANGEVFPLEASISRAGEGDLQRMTVMARDVTKLREAERAQLASTAAQAASQAKTEFLSRISHELRTPLNAVLGFAQLMREDTREPLGERHRAQIELVLQAGSHLSTLIEEMLDVARIETGRMSLDERDFELCELLRGTMALCEPQALQAQVSLQAAYADVAPVSLRTDPARLRQVMLNLLSNAIKYNRPGGWVRVQVQHQGGAIHIVVEDNGLGMSEQQKSRLFQPFNRLGREHSGVQGTGIGLVLVRQLVNLMQGEITVDTRPDEGTRVRVSLPASQALAAEPLAPQRAGAATPDPAREGVVLYIEDNPVNAVLVEQLLSRWPKVRTVIATDGRFGLERAHALRPDVVLLDMELPDMDGMAVLRALKADAATRDLPVVVLSATAGALDMRSAHEAGALHYWTKPIDFDRFIEGMRQVLPPAAQAGRRQDVAADS